MKNIHRVCLAAMLTCAAVVGKTQDSQISQPDAAEILFNPANTGMLKYTDLRISALYRSQWSSLSTSFNTFTMAFDMAYDERWGFGAVFINSDEANVLSSSGFLISGGYQVSDPAQTKFLLTAGVQLGVIYKRVNTDHMIFDSQFDGYNFDSAIPSMEHFDKHSRWMPDANIGMSYKSTDRNKKINPFADFAVFHITSPNEAFVGEKKSKLPVKWMGNLGARVSLDRELYIEPSVTYWKQREATQFLINTMAFYEVRGTPYQILGGLGYRTSDAVIAHAGLRHNANIFRISYDVNVSGLSTYTNNRGALEFSVIYRPGRRTSRSIY